MKINKLSEDYRTGFADGLSAGDDWILDWCEKVLINSKMNARTEFFKLARKVRLTKMKKGINNGERTTV